MRAKPKVLLSAFRASIETSDALMSVADKHGLIYSHVMLEAISLWLLSHNHSAAFDNVELRPHLDKVMERTTGTKHPEKL